MRSREAIKSGHDGMGVPRRDSIDAALLVDAALRTNVELVEALCADAPWAGRELWNRYSSTVRRYFARRLGVTTGEADDLTQDVLLRVFAHRRNIRQPEALPEFTRAVMVRALKAKVRSRFSRRAVQLSPDGTLPEVPIDRRGEEERRDALARCQLRLDALLERERTAFMLRYMESLTIDDIAARMKVSRSTARRLVARALRKIRTNL